MEIKPRKRMEIKWRQKIENIYLFPTKVAYDDIFLYEQILIITDQVISIKPIVDTDEIKILVKNKTRKNLTNAIIYQAFNNRELMEIWRCRNDQGYFDQVVVGIDDIWPTFSIVCELGLLGIFVCEPLKGKPIQK